MLVLLNNLVCLVLNKSVARSRNNVKITYERIEENNLPII